MHERPSRRPQILQVDGLAVTLQTSVGTAHKRVLEADVTTVAATDENRQSTPIGSFLVASTSARRPMTFVSKTRSNISAVFSAMSCFREVEKIFDAAGVRDRLELDLFEGGHQWGGNKSVEFFRRWLGGSELSEVPARDRDAGLTLTLNRARLREMHGGGAPERLPYAVGGGSAGDEPAEDKDAT